MFIPVCGCSGADSGPASLQLLPADPNSGHLPRDRASPPGQSISPSPWSGVAAGTITLAVKSHFQALINSWQMLLLVWIRPPGAVGEPCSLPTSPRAGRHLPPPFDSRLGTKTWEIRCPPSQHPPGQQGGSALLPIPRFFTPKQRENRQFKQSDGLIFRQSLLCFTICQRSLQTSLRKR